MSKAVSLLAIILFSTIAFAEGNKADYWDSKTKSQDVEVSKQDAVSTKNKEITFDSPELLEMHYKDCLKYLKKSDAECRKFADEKMKMVLDLARGSKNKAPLENKNSSSKGATSK